MKLYKFFFMLTILTLMVCKPSPSKKDVLNFSYLQQNCLNCHSLEESAVRSAPSLFEIRKFYLNDSIDDKVFKEKIIAYINNPVMEKSINQDWIHKYGVMPKMTFSPIRLEDSITYLYRSNWGSKNWKNKYKTYIEDPSIGRKLLNEDMSKIEKAQLAAMMTKSSLGSNLMKSMKEKGTIGAIEFCNTKAIPLTQEMSSQLGYDISRVSDKPRNANNYANKQELEIIKKYKNQLQVNEEIKPIEINLERNSIIYYPIQTNSGCLKCHGNLKTDIQEPVLKKIQSLYPNDKAVGYKPNEIRGLFKVVFSKG